MSLPDNTNIKIYQPVDKNLQNKFQNELVSKVDIKRFLGYSRTKDIYK